MLVFFLLSSCNFSCLISLPSALMSPRGRYYARAVLIDFLFTHEHCQKKNTHSWTFKVMEWFFFCCNNRCFTRGHEGHTAPSTSVDLLLSLCSPPSILLLLSNSSDGHRWVWCFKISPALTHLFCLFVARGFQTNKWSWPLISCFLSKTPLVRHSFQVVSCVLSLSASLFPVGLRIGSETAFVF